MTNEQLEKVLWSIALPGFGQLLNGQIVKGLAFITLEIINVQSNFNKIILLSFHGNIQKAIEQADYQWLSLYLFSIWDAYKDAGGGKSPYSVLPLVFSAYFTTVGLIYSPTFKMYLAINFCMFWQYIYKI